MYQSLHKITHLPEFAHLAYAKQIYAGPLLFIPIPHSGLFTFPSPLLSKRSKFRSPAVSQTDFTHLLISLLKQGLKLRQGDVITLINHDQTRRPSPYLYTHQRGVIKQELVKEAAPPKPLRGEVGSV